MQRGFESECLVFKEVLSLRHTALLPGELGSCSTSRELTAGS